MSSKMPWVSCLCSGAFPKTPQNSPIRELTIWPPMTGSASTRTTARPRRADSSAADSPAIPAPTTHTSAPTSWTVPPAGLVTVLTLSSVSGCGISTPTQTTPDRLARLRRGGDPGVIPEALARPAVSSPGLAAVDQHRPAGDQRAVSAPANRSRVVPGSWDAGPPLGCSLCRAGDGALPRATRAQDRPERCLSGEDARNGPHGEADAGEAGGDGHGHGPDDRRGDQPDRDQHGRVEQDQAGAAGRGQAGADVVTAAGCGGGEDGDHREQGKEEGHADRCGDRPRPGSSDDQGCCPAGAERRSGGQQRRRGPPSRRETGEAGEDLLGVAELADGRCRGAGWFQAVRQVLLIGLDEAVDQLVDGVGWQPPAELGAVGVDQGVAGHGLCSSSAVTAPANSRQLLRSPLS